MPLLLLVLLLSYNTPRHSGRLSRRAQSPLISEPPFVVAAAGDAVVPEPFRVSVPVFFQREGSASSGPPVPLVRDCASLNEKEQKDGGLGGFLSAFGVEGEDWQAPSLRTSSSSMEERSAHQAASREPSYQVMRGLLPNPTVELMGRCGGLHWAQSGREAATRPAYSPLEERMATGRPFVPGHLTSRKILQHCLCP